MTTPELPTDISIKYGNIMFVDGEFTQTGDSVYFRKVMKLARTMIVGAIETQYQKTLSTAPEVQRGSVWLARLNEDEDEVLTAEAIERKKGKKAHSEVYFDAKAIMPEYLGYFGAVEGVGLIPVFRKNPGPPKNMDYMKGICLLARDTHFRR